MYALPELSEPAWTALAHGGALGCASAAESLGLWVVAFKGVHVWLGPTGHQRVHSDCRCVSHWGEAHAFSTGKPVMTVGLALEQIAHCLGREAFFVALESALFQGKIDASAIVRLQSKLPEAFGELFRLATATSESGLESLLRYRLSLHGIAVQAQVDVPGVGRVDFVVGDRLILEADGRDNHESPGQRHRDLVRDAHAAALGFETLRFDFALIVHGWEAVEAAILAKVGLGSHESAAGLRMRDEAPR